MAPPKDIYDVTTLRKIGSNEYESIYDLETMGHPLGIVYGGSTLAVTTQAAYCDIRERSDHAKLAIYSFVGTYLSPVLSTRPIQIIVTPLRDTRNFATRLVTVTQVQSNGEKRKCLSATVDFMISPKKNDDDPSLTLLRYSVPPSEAYSHYSTFEDVGIVTQKRVDRGDLDPKLAQLGLKSLRDWDRYLQMKYCPEGILGQTIFGVDYMRKTTQEDRKITEKRSGDWCRSTLSLRDKTIEGYEPISKSAATSAIIAFFLDQQIPFLPVTFTHRGHRDVSAATALEFALRFHHNYPDFTQWHFREVKTIAGGWGRTFGDAHLWNEKGELVATMSQQSILTPLKGAKI